MKSPRSNVLPHIYFRDHHDYSGLHRVPLWTQVLLIVLGVVFGAVVIALIVCWVIYPPFIQWWRSGAVAPEPTIDLQPVPPAWLLGNDSFFFFIILSSLFLFYQERLVLTLFFYLQNGRLLIMDYVFCIFFMYIYIYIYIGYIDFYIWILSLWFLKIILPKTFLNNMWRLIINVCILQKKKKCLHDLLFITRLIFLGLKVVVHYILHQLKLNDYFSKTFWYILINQ